jgi:hypothetical protein
VPAKKAPAAGKESAGKEDSEEGDPEAMTEMLTTVIALLVAVIGLVTLVIRGQAKAQRPNGGKSQYDLLLRIEGRLDRLERNQDEHLRHHLKE